MPRSIHVLIMFIHLVHEHLSEAHSWQYIDTSSKGLSVSTPLVGGAETQAPFATFIKVRQVPRGQAVGRPSYLCVCRVGTPPARKYIYSVSDSILRCKL